MNKILSLLFPKIARRLFIWRIEHEIYDRIFPHLRGDKDYGYPFRTDEQMRAQTKEVDVRPVLDAIEEHFLNMQDAYGESFRYIIHRDLHDRLRMYESLARDRVELRSEATVKS